MTTFHVGVYGRVDRATLVTELERVGREVGFGNDLNADEPYDVSLLDNPTPRQL